MQNKFETSKNTEEINKEINKDIINKKRPRLYNIRKARQLGYFYNFETGRYETYRKFSNLSIIKSLSHFVSGTYKKKK